MQVLVHYCHRTHMSEREVKLHGNPTVEASLKLYREALGDIDLDDPDEGLCWRWDFDGTTGAWSLEEKTPDGWMLVEFGQIAELTAVASTL